MFYGFSFAGVTGEREESETDQKRFWRVRFQTPSSVSFLALTELRGENVPLSLLFVCQSELTEVVAELTKFAAELSSG